MATRIPPIPHSAGVIRGIAIAAMAVPVAAVMLIALCVARLPLSGQPLIAVFPPWWRQADMLIAASTAGRVLEIGPAGFTVVLLPDPARGTAALFRHGALLVTGAGALWGCGPDRNTQSGKDFGV